MKENVFDYLPLTFFVEVDIGNPKQFAKALLSFSNAFYALEENKKKANKYYLKLDEYLNQ